MPEAAAPLENPPSHRRTEEDKKFQVLVFLGEQMKSLVLKALKDVKSPAVGPAPHLRQNSLQMPPFIVELTHDVSRRTRGNFYALRILEPHGNQLREHMISYDDEFSDRKRKNVLLMSSEGKICAINSCAENTGSTGSTEAVVLMDWFLRMIQKVSNQNI